MGAKTSCSSRIGLSIARRFAKLGTYRSYYVGLFRASEKSRNLCRRARGFSRFKRIDENPRQEHHHVSCPGRSTYSKETSVQLAEPPLVVYVVAMRIVRAEFLHRPAEVNDIHA